LSCPVYPGQYVLHGRGFDIHLCKTGVIRPYVIKRDLSIGSQVLYVRTILN
jgi:hypothetical protein